MIISIAPVRTSWCRRAVVVLACAGLTALFASWLDIEAPSPSPSPSSVAAQTAPVVQREITRPLLSDPYRQAPVAVEATRRITQVVGTVLPPTPQLPTFPFRFLGKLDVEGAISVVLYGRGRTLTVQGPGPLDGEYVVDAIEEGYLMLRHLPSGTSHILELASRQHTTIPAGSAAETAPD